jgi:hypothetical protein
MSETLSPLIQAALAPVFLLSAIGVTLSVIDTRQNRIVEHVRALERQLADLPTGAFGWEQDLAVCLHRARQIGRAAALCILSAISVAIVVVGLLTDAQTDLSLTILVEVAFSGAMLFYGLSLVLFLRDVLLVGRGIGGAERRLTAALASARCPPD